MLITNKLRCANAILRGASVNQIPDYLLHAKIPAKGYAPVVQQCDRSCLQRARAWLT